MNAHECPFCESPFPGGGIDDNDACCDEAQPYWNQVWALDDAIERFDCFGSQDVIVRAKLVEWLEGFAPKPAWAKAVTS